MAGCDARHEPGAGPNPNSSSPTPSAMFARVEKGETPVQRPEQSRHDELVERGIVRPAPDGPEVGEWDRFTHIAVSDDADPRTVLLDLREHER